MGEVMTCGGVVCGEGHCGLCVVLCGDDLCSVYGDILVRRAARRVDSYCLCYLRKVK